MCFFLRASVFFISVLSQLVLALLLALRHSLYVTFSLGCVQKPFSPSSLDLVPHFHHSPVFGFCVGTRCHSMFTGLHGVLLLLSSTQDLFEEGFIHLGRRREEKELD